MLLPTLLAPNRAHNLPLLLHVVSMRARLSSSTASTWAANGCIALHVIFSKASQRDLAKTRMLVSHNSFFEVPSTTYHTSPEHSLRCSLSRDTEAVEHVDPGWLRDWMEHAFSTCAAMDMYRS
jgi:hypothetical protein